MYLKKFFLTFILACLPTFANATLIKYDFSGAAQGLDNNRPGETIDLGFMYTGSMTFNKSSVTLIDFWIKSTAIGGDRASELSPFFYSWNGSLPVYDGMGPYPYGENGETDIYNEFGSFRLDLGDATFFLGTTESYIPAGANPWLYFRWSEPSAAMNFDGRDFGFGMDIWFEEPKILTSVPEPTSFGLGVAALAGLFLNRRMKLKKP